MHARLVLAALSFVGVTATVGDVLPKGSASKAAPAAAEAARARWPDGGGLGEGGREIRPRWAPTLGSVRWASDTALAELQAGRYWHAARSLRAEGAAEGGPEEVLLLARAEAGWENWAAVRELLEDVEWVGEPGVERAAGGALGGGKGAARTGDDGQALADALYLLGRAREADQDWGEASSPYLAFAAHPSADPRLRLAALARGARAAWRSGEESRALALLAELRPAPHLRSWIAVELALDAASAGDVDAVAALTLHAVEPTAAGELWRAEADAYLSAPDSAAALEAFARALALHSGARGIVAAVELGRLRVARGDTIAGRTLLLEAFGDARGGARTRAAETLHDLGGHDATLTLELARVLDRGGDGARALAGYDRARLLQRDAGRDLPAASRLARARLMSTVRSRQEEALEEFRAIRETTEEASLGAQNLEAWAQMRRRQGMSAQVATLRRWLLEDYPGSAQAAEVVWSQGNDAESRGALDRALERYAFLAANARTHARAGQARMRTGQIHLRRGEREEAAEVFEQYLADFPTGRRWQEAAYWAGRTRMELGDTVAARRHLRHVLTQPVEYYAVMAADLVGVPFAVDVPEGEGATEPGWLTAGLRRLDLLAEAGSERGVAAEIDRLEERAGGERGPRLRLAEALIDRGHTIDGINLGWALLDEAGSWDRQVLRVAYPFPYRELVRLEAEEWGIDPFMMAAIIRQESAFKADIVSRAGAIGLMQVMPPTGAQLARAHGPDGFTESALTKPEVNLHLGAAFFVEMSRRYDHELPLVLSAYNAGPTRATRWRRYPEASDPLRFTERIPFTETRGYVKSVRRNLGLYRALYGLD